MKLTPNRYAPADYPLIAAYGARMGSLGHYIRHEQERAAAMGAPLTTYALSHDDKPLVLADIKNRDILESLVRHLMADLAITRAERDQAQAS